MGCYLWTEGRHFDVDAYLARSGFVNVNVWRKGELIRGRNPLRNTLKTSGFGVRIIGRTFDDLAKQCRYATRFLSRNRRELERLRRFKGMKEMYLDFGIRWREMFTHTDSLPRELIAAAGELGISIYLSHYPISGKHPRVTTTHRCAECGQIRKS